MFLENVDCRNQSQVSTSRVSDIRDLLASMISGRHIVIASQSCVGRHAYVSVQKLSFSSGSA